MAKRAYDEETEFEFMQHLIEGKEQPAALFEARIRPTE